MKRIALEAPSIINSLPIVDRNPVLALQFARMAGASIIALTSTSEKAARLKEVGVAGSKGVYR